MKIYFWVLVTHDKRMGRKENIKRMKKMRAEKKERLKGLGQLSELDQIAKEAANKLVDNLSPFQMTRRNTGPLKYSDLLKEFLSPYLHECRDFKDTEKLFSGGALAWNIAVASQSKGAKEHEEMVKVLEKELKTTDITDFFRELIDRKLEHFSQHKVLYDNVQLIENEKAFGLSVAVIQID